MRNGASTKQFFQLITYDDQKMKQITIDLAFATFKPHTEIK